MLFGPGGVRPGCQQLDRATPMCMAWMLLLLRTLPEPGVSVRAPNTSLETIPAAYFGGHHNKPTAFHGNASCASTGCRPAANVQMLAKMRLIMIEKWEGHCYDGCMYNASKGKACFSSCNVEADMLKTLSAAKSINPDVLGIMYINTLMAFPFYHLAGQFAAAGALLMDMYTKRPVELTNDEGMQHVFVYDWGSPKARQLFVGFVKNLLDRGQADGIFSDKWNYRCTQVNDTTYKVCNNRCGYVTPAQAAAYNNGAAGVREQISVLLQANSTSPETFNGFLYADGLSNVAKCPPATYPDGMVKVNLVGGWATWRPQLGYVTSPSYMHLSGPEREDHVRGAIDMVKTYQACGYKYIYIGCGDHSNNAHYVSNELDPDDLMTDCSLNHHALFLLLVEEGVFLGANGWHADYDKPLGAPLGPAYNATDPQNSTRRLLVRQFESGTNVSWDLDAGYGIINWVGCPPGVPPPMPAPRPAPGPPKPPRPPTPAPPPSSDCDFEQDVDYKDGVAAKTKVSNATECCGACKASEDCAAAVLVESSGECFLKPNLNNKVHSLGRVSCKPR